MEEPLSPKEDQDLIAVLVTMAEDSGYLPLHGAEKPLTKIFLLDRIILLFSISQAMDTQRKLMAILFVHTAETEMTAYR